MKIGKSTKSNKVIGLMLTQSYYVVNNNPRKQNEYYIKTNSRGVNLFVFLYNIKLL